MKKTAIQKLISRCETLASTPMSDVTGLALAALAISEVIQDAKSELEYFPYISKDAKDSTINAIDEAHL